MGFNTIVDAATLAQHLNDPAWVIFDCRFSLLSPDQGRGEYAQAHVPNARYADLDKDLAGPKRPGSGRHPLPDPDGFIEWLRNNGVNGGSQVVAYDGSGGMIAARLWWMMRWLGHRHIAVLDGGWPAWVAQGYPATAAVSQPVSGDFTGKADRSMWLSTGEVESRVREANTRDILVDARTAARFNGEREPIDPVAGHIPGAVNRPCGDNLDKDGYFLSADQLRPAFQALIGDRQPREVVHTCGSGVSACRNILAMEIAGWPDTRLYVGSWSEWIADPGRPIEPAS